MKTIFISLILAMALPFISYASKTQINDNGDVANPNNYNFNWLRTEVIDIYPSN